MLIFFLIPLCSIALAPFLRHYRGARFNFGLTLLYSILNLLHFGFDVAVGAPSYQLFLMLILVCIGGGLNWVTFHWMTQLSSRIVKGTLN